jgi:hypothetical protein
LLRQPVLKLELRNSAIRPATEIAIDQKRATRCSRVAKKNEQSLDGLNRALADRVARQGQIAALEPRKICRPTF